MGALTFRVGVTACVLMLLVTLSVVEPDALAEQASQPESPEAGLLDAGSDHSCAAVAAGGLRCWGFGGDGRLGYGNLETIGDNETPGSAGPVDLGTGRTATALSGGGFHTCALLNDARVRCWGSNVVGQLGYRYTGSIGDNETPGSAGPVDLGTGATGSALTAKAIAAGGGHTCAVLENGDVRCWGSNAIGQLGYPDSEAAIGDTETPGSVGPVDFAPGDHTATAISAGRYHTCAILEDASVRCWGNGIDGRLGYGSEQAIGDDETPGSAGPVDLGTGATGSALTAKAISAGGFHTCAILDDDSVRCWGYGGDGALGYGNRDTIGDDETPGSAGPVYLGPDRKAKAISAGTDHTCALLDDGKVRCWGYAGLGQLGYGNLSTIGDDETPGSVGPVNLGPGRATAISAGRRHTCARLEDGTVRCWGYAATGQLGYCSVENIGDDETPAAAGPVALAPPAGGGPGCLPSGGGSPQVPAPAPPEPGPPEAVDPLAAALRAEAARRRGFRSCLSEAATHTRREVRRARRLSGSRAAEAGRHLRRHRTTLRRRCVKRWGRTPGPVTGLQARASSRGSVRLTFKAAGSDGSRLPAARAYLVKQSRRPIRSGRDFRRAQTLCKGSCRFPTGIRVGGDLLVTVTDLRPATTYYYAVAARDNVSRRLGARSRAVGVRTR